MSLKPADEVHMKSLYEKLMRGFDEAKLVGDDRIILSFTENEIWALALALASLAPGKPVLTIDHDAAMKEQQLKELDWTLYIAT